ncbi:MAG TPA: iron transporter, partial [Syntrophobacteraceae bacterium]|nr:iron transporter [Syntrophobacteraceae bacterium]HBZ55972.1 iron transporter [Syntrophobacteraceae bacterium]
MTRVRNRLGQGLQRGLGRGFRGFLWMAKILIPISFLTALLQWSGWLGHIEFLVRPITGLVGLPATAALPMIIGMLTNIYGGIAAMVVLPFTREQMTLIAIFLLICHNLIQEGVVQAQSGIHPLKATLFRLVAAILTVALVALCLRPESVAVDPGLTSAGNTQPFGAMLASWSLLTLKLLAKIFVIIISILTALAVFQEFGWIEPIVRALRPLLRALGLNEKVGLLWMTAAVFGLAYGAAVIVEEAKRGDLTKEELESLHLSIGINHSMVEDPMLFLALGL